MPGLAFFTILLFDFHSSTAQTTRKATEYQSEFEEKAQILNQKLGDLHLSLWQNESRSKTQDRQIVAIKSTKKALSDFQQKSPFMGQENVKLAYIRFCQTLLNEIEKIRTPTEDSRTVVSFDSLIHYREGWIRSWSVVTHEASRLKSEVDNFAMANRIPGRKSLTNAADGLTFALRRMEIALSFLKPTLAVRLKFQEILQNLPSDSFPQMETKRLALLQDCEKSILEAKAVSPFPGDQELKNAAQNSLRLYRLEIVNDFPHIVEYVKRERNFRKIHLEMKQLTEPSEAEKNRYRQAVANYNLNLKEANECISTTEKKRKEHEDAFDQSFLKFFNGGLQRF